MTLDIAQHSKFFRTTTPRFRFFFHLHNSHEKNFRNDFTKRAFPIQGSFLRIPPPYISTYFQYDFIPRIQTFFFIRKERKSCFEYEWITINFIFTGSDPFFGQVLNAFFLPEPIWFNRPKILFTLYLRHFSPLTFFLLFIKKWKYKYSYLTFINDIFVCVLKASVLKKNDSFFRFYTVHFPQRIRLFIFEF